VIYIGIDPGVSGGIAALTDNGMVIDAIKMPVTDQDVLAVTRFYSERADVEGPCRAVLERVNAGVFGGRKTGQSMGVTSAFTFGTGVGRLRMALAASDIPFDEIAPVSWQTALQCRSRGDKNVTKARAQQLFPKEKVTHAIADALLLAEYCRRLHRGIILRSSTEEGRDVENPGQKKGKGRKEGRARKGVADGF
jgi:Holliday junction resolvasome RuvABC endonuclease subunit